nr:helix-turn-helix transcriptional regulator [Mucilaginibacter sp. L294]
MHKKTTSIPVNNFGGEYHTGISIEKMSLNDIPNFEGEEQSERHDRHSFHLLEKGTITIDIDFQRYEMKSPSVIYMHPNQVHRIITFENVTVSSWAINNVNLNPEYLKLLEDITPVKPLPLNAETFSIIAEAVSLCIKFAERKTAKLYHSLLKDSCNALVALAVSPYLEQSKSTDKLSRFETVTKTFRELLERNYTIAKRPADYAEKLNISTPYLNECVKNATGYSVSYHIQQRVILEAKRLLYHSSQSVKEIAAALGYDDFPYFSRLFTKVAGITALTFRNKNLG